MPPSAFSPPGASPVPWVAILGADAILAARPAAAPQLARACERAGFARVVPASWGDELVAHEVLRQLANRPGQPAVQCSCPHVAARLLATGPELADFLLPVVAPPVAVARYLRRAHGPGPVHVTYIGTCPAAESQEIDARLTPAALLTALAERGIRLDEQPAAPLPAGADRRRFYSLPGGVPAPGFLAREVPPRRLAEATSDDYPTEVAEHLVNGDVVLVDVAPRLGCACAGAGAGRAAAQARTEVMALEPLRATRAVIDPSIEVPVAGSLDELVGRGSRGDTLPAPGAPPVPEVPASGTPGDAPSPRRLKTPALGTPRLRGGTGREGAPPRLPGTPTVVPHLKASGTPEGRGGGAAEPAAPRASGLHRPPAGHRAVDERAAPGRRRPTERAEPGGRTPRVGAPADEVRPIELSNESGHPQPRLVERTAPAGSRAPVDGPALRAESTRVPVGRAGTIRGPATPRNINRHRRGRRVRIGGLTAGAGALLVLAAGAALGAYLGDRRAATRDRVVTPDSSEFVTLPTPRTKAPPATTPGTASPASAGAPPTAAPQPPRDSATAHPDSAPRPLSAPGPRLGRGPGADSRGRGGGSR